MKFIQLADLHFGKKVFNYDLNEEQKDALQQVLAVADSQKIDGVLICGDIYDSATPSVEAIQLFDWFLNELYDRNLHIFLISGNHDSAGRLNFASKILNDSKVHIVSIYDGSIPYFDMEKENQRVRIHMLPFIKPAKVKSTLGIDPEGDWTKAVKMALAKTHFLKEGFNLLLSHQFYAGGKAAESEELTIGSLDVVSTEVLKDFDYVALGHLHNPQNVKKPIYRYCGTLLKFSASELAIQKTITLLSIENNQVEIEEIPVHPKRDFVSIRGTFDELVSNSFVKRQNIQNYFYVVLDDDQEVFQVFEKLSLRYPRLLKIEYSKKSEPSFQESEEIISDSEMAHPEEIFAKFYEMQNGEPIDSSLQEILINLWNEIKTSPGE